MAALERCYHNMLMQAARYRDSCMLPDVKLKLR